MGTKQRGREDWDVPFRRTYPWETVVAAKKYNGVVVGYIVGWKSPYCGRVRNIRAGRYFAKVEDAKAFQKEIEAGRNGRGVEFDIIK